MKNNIPAEELKRIESEMAQNLPEYLQDGRDKGRFAWEQGYRAGASSEYLRSLERLQYLSNLLKKIKEITAINTRVYILTAAALSKLRGIETAEIYGEKQAAKGPRWVKASERLPIKSGKYPIKMIDGDMTIGNFHAYEKEPAMYNTFYLSPERYKWLDESGAGDDSKPAERKQLPSELALWLRDAEDKYDHQKSYQDAYAAGAIDMYWEYCHGVENPTRLSFVKFAYGCMHERDELAKKLAGDDGAEREKVAAAEGIRWVLANTFGRTSLDADETINLYFQSQNK